MKHKRIVFEQSVDSFNASVEFWEEKGFELKGGVRIEKPSGPFIAKMVRKSSPIKDVEYEHEPQLLNSIQEIDGVLISMTDTNGVACTLLCPELMTKELYYEQAASIARAAFKRAYELLTVEMHHADFQVADFNEYWAKYGVHAPSTDTATQSEEAKDDALMQDIEDRTVFVAATISGKTVSLHNRLKSFGDECWEKITQQLCDHYGIQLLPEEGNPTLRKLAARIFLAVDAKREAKTESQILNTELLAIEEFVLRQAQKITGSTKVRIDSNLTILTAETCGKIESVCNEHYSTEACIDGCINLKEFAGYVHESWLMKRRNATKAKPLPVTQSDTAEAKGVKPWNYESAKGLLLGIAKGELGGALPNFPLRLGSNDFPYGAWQTIFDRFVSALGISKRITFGFRTFDHLYEILDWAMDEYEAAKPLPKTPLQDIQDFVLDAAKKLTGNDSLTLDHNCHVIGIDHWRDIEGNTNARFGTRTKFDHKNLVGANSRTLRHLAGATYTQCLNGAQPATE